MTGFMQAYKRLDNLCRDMNGLGVTGYLGDMERMRNTGYDISNWDLVYRTLKHYRYIRNRIAHENNVGEEDVCVPEDTEWIEDFYQSILNCSDPLALYYQRAKACQRLDNTQRRTYQPARKENPYDKPEPTGDGHRTTCLIIIVSAVVFLLFFLVKAIQ